MQDSATLDLTGKELGNVVCFDTCKEDPNCGGVYIKVKSVDILSLHYTSSNY